MSKKKNIGTILMFHLEHQVNCAQGDIACGGVITMLANSLGMNFTNILPIVGNTLVNINVRNHIVHVVSYLKKYECSKMRLRG